MNRIKQVILYSLLRKPKSFWELLAENQYLLGDFVKAVNDLYEEGLIKELKGKLSLSKDAKKLLNENAAKFHAEKCKWCNGKGFVLSEEFQKLLKTFKRISKEHPPILAEFYQGKIIPEDTVFRIALMHKYGDVADKNIVLIGDDDLLSIALALTNLPKRIVVFDIDKRLGEFIEKVSRKYKLEIEFVEYDVANPLPKEFVKKFDVFSTEPLETDTGFKAFIARGASCIKAGGSGYIGLTALEVSFKRWAKFQKMILDNGFVITDVIRNFSWYCDSEREEEREQYQEFVRVLNFNPGKPRTWWYASTLIRIESLGKHKAPVKWNKKIKIIPVDNESFTHPELYE